MIRLVDDLLDVSRIARGKIVLVSEKVVVADIVAAAVEIVQPLLDQKGQQLTVEEVRPAARGARRPGAPRAGGGQSAAQRGQIHGRGRPHFAVGSREPGSRRSLRA